MARTIAEELMERGIEKGELRGGRGVLLKLLRLKFGEVDAAALARVEAGGVEDVERWAERVLTAETLAAVFDD